MHELNKINFFLMVKMTHLHPYTHFGKASQDIKRILKISLKQQRKNMPYSIACGKPFSQGDAMESSAFAEELKFASSTQKPKSPSVRESFART